MPVLQRNVPVVTTEPTLLVERLPAGTHRIQLVVIDQSGNESAPAIATVNVIRFQPPTGPVILDPPIVVQPVPPIIRQPPVIGQPVIRSPQPESAPAKKAAKKTTAKRTAAKKTRKAPRKEKP